MPPNREEKRDSATAEPINFDPVAVDLDGRGLVHGRREITPELQKAEFDTQNTTGAPKVIEDKVVGN